MLPNTDPLSREDRIDAALAEYLQAAESGNPILREDFLASYPDLADELSEFLADHAMFGRAAGAFSAPTLPASSAADLPHQHLGEYELVREIGRGGMGVVYEAVQSTLRRHVAVKVLNSGLVGDAVAVMRFRREAEAAARLQHPHIVPVYGVGQEGATHYFAMELVAGQSLDRAAEELSSPTDFVTLARRFAAVADALQHAHERGVIHRDIKPSNLLLAADGRLLVGDFGLARMLELPGLTQTGEFAGTPRYMSPEQIAGGKTIDGRTDIYSLGATLYERLAGQPPFMADTRNEVLVQIMQSEPKPPSRWNGAVPLHLETICLKCLAKEPARRYQEARDLAADLRRFADGQSILARPEGAIVRAARRLQRSPAVPLVAACACLLGLAAMLFAWQALAWRGELVATQRQDAIDAALVAAMSGDLEQTDQAIAQAERLGASAGWVAMLRGQSSYHRSDYDVAVVDLERAVSLLPESVAARSMLATAYLGAGLWEKYEQTLQTLETLQAQTPHDMLFQGLAESFLDPARAMTLMNDAVRRRDSPMARLMRAEVRASHALDTGELPAAEAAVIDVGIAREMLPANPAVLIVSLEANLIASGNATDAGYSDRAEEYQAAANSAARAMEAFSHLPTVIYHRALFLQQLERHAEAFEVLSRGVEKSADAVVRYNFALMLFQRSEIDRALDVMSHAPHPSADESFLRTLLLHDKGRDAEAMELYHELGEKYPTGLTALFRPTLRLLMSRRDDAVADWKSFRNANGLPRLRRTFYEALLAFNCGELTEDELLNAAGPSHWDQCEAHYFLGVHDLSLGNHDRAQKHFEASIACRCSGFMAWDWSRTMLLRADRHR